MLEIWCKGTAFFSIITNHFLQKSNHFLTFCIFFSRYIVCFHIQISKMIIDSMPLHGANYLPVQRNLRKQTQQTNQIISLCRNPFFMMFSIRSSFHSRACKKRNLPPPSIRSSLSLRGLRSSLRSDIFFL